MKVGLEVIISVAKRLANILKEQVIRIAELGEHGKVLGFHLNQNVTTMYRKFCKF